MSQDDDLIDLAVPDNRDCLELVDSVRACVHSITELTALDDDDDSFLGSMDSLQALRLTRALRRSLFLPSLALSTIYQNASISRLSAALAEHGGVATL